MERLKPNTKLEPTNSYINWLLESRNSRAIIFGSFFISDCLTVVAYYDEEDVYSVSAGAHVPLLKIPAAIVIDMANAYGIH